MHLSLAAPYFLSLVVAASPPLGAPPFSLGAPPFSLVAAPYPLAAPPFSLDAAALLGLHIYLVSFELV